MLTDPCRARCRCWPILAGPCCPILAESGCRCWPILVESGCRRWPVLVEPGCPILAKPGCRRWPVLAEPGCRRWPILVEPGCRCWPVGYLQKLCIQLKINVCSCHRALYAICIYRGGAVSVGGGSDVGLSQHDWSSLPPVGVSTRQCLVGVLAPCQHTKTSCSCGWHGCPD
jgi:hypothetical protein